jgi:hypothetical protein
MLMISNDEHLDVETNYSGQGLSPGNRWFSKCLTSIHFAGKTGIGPVPVGLTIDKFIN